MTSEIDRLRVALLEAQHAVRDGRGAVMVLLAGLPGSSKGDVLKKLHEWMDVRYLRTHAFHPPNRTDRQNPMMWRYWMVTPGQGETRFYVDAWYEEVVFQRARRHMNRAAMARALSRIRAFEADLAASGISIQKFWLSLSRETQAARFAVWEGLPYEAWRVTDDDRWCMSHFERVDHIWSEVRRVTDSPWAPWQTLPENHVEGSATGVAETLIQAIRGPAAPIHLTRNEAPELPSRLESAIRPTRHAVSGAGHVRHGLLTDPTRAMAPDEYGDRLKAAQGAFGQAVRAMYSARKAAVFAFEGWDAAGKGGAIRRLVAAVDPRQYQVISISAPDESARRHHWLWRFWRHVPRAGHLTVFDRSWYGRVLVERVEGLTPEARWCRSFDEINEFERQLSEHGILVAKFWLEISDAEQLARFEARRKTPYKRHKITEEDLRNRARRPDYELALEDMFHHTHTSYAPWQVIPAENKRAARVAVLERATALLNATLAANAPDGAGSTPDDAGSDPDLLAPASSGNPGTGESAP